MRAVVDYNEVLFHRLEAIHSHLQITRGTHGAPGTQPDVGQGLIRGQPNDIGAYSGSNAQNVLDQYQSLDELPRRIMGIVTQEAENHHDGVHVSHIARMLRNVDIAQVRSAVEDLSSEGYLYTAADDDHVLPTA
jgi:replication factor A2